LDNQADYQYSCNLYDFLFFLNHIFEARDAIII